MNTATQDPIGNFIEKDYGLYFEYSNNTTDLFPDYPHLVWVGDTIGAGWCFRYANVKQTVAYICTNEDDNGPIVEKWNIKQNKKYNT